jgi:hypothetical protein
LSHFFPPKRRNPTKQELKGNKAFVRAISAISIGGYHLFCWKKALFRLKVFCRASSNDNVDKKEIVFVQKKKL